MSVILTDRMTFDAPKRTKEGYMAVRAKAARSGVYDYLGAEVDPTGSKFKSTDTVRVYRPEDEVFDAASVRSFIMRPITNNHPTEAVTADNWSKLAKGVVAGAIRDGDHLAFDLVFMDAAIVSDIQSGKRELSNGYSTDLVFQSGTAPDGAMYDAIQKSIVGNHVALVDRGRAGPSCAIGVCDAISSDQVNSIMANLGDKKPMKTILVDGHSVEVSDAAEIAIANLNAKLADAAKVTADLATANTTISTLTASVSAKDGEIAVLKQAVADATITPAKLDQLVADRTAVVDAATKIFPALDAKGKTTEAIRKEAVSHKLGDAAKTMDDAAIGGAFAALSAQVGATDTMRDGIAQITPASPNIATDARAKMIADMTNPKAA